MENDSYLPDMPFALDSDGYALFEPRPPYGPTPAPAYFSHIRHSYERRADWHDYKERCFYHIILKKADYVPVFCTIKAILDSDGSPVISRDGKIYYEYHLTPLGEQIKYLICDFRKLDIPATFEKFMIMPDHIHITVFVRERFESGLSYLMRSFKRDCTFKMNEMKADGQVVSKATSVFREGYTDKILTSENQLHRWNNYIADNPRRYMIKKLNNVLFTRRYRRLLNGREYELVGNITLMEHPDKAAVKVSRRYSMDEKEGLKAQWLAHAEKGGVLISPFIHPEEREIKQKAYELGGGVIIIRLTPFMELEKPDGADFDAFAKGRVLFITPVREDPRFRKVTKVMADRMNLFAAAIAEGSRC